MMYQEKAAVAVPSFKDVIQQQHIDGYWKDSAESILSQFFMGKTIIDAAVLDEINKADIENVIRANLTLVALYILQEEFEGREEEWKLIAKKGKEYLKSVGIQNPDALVRKFKLIKLIK